MSVPWTNPKLHGMIRWFRVLEMYIKESEHSNPQAPRRWNQSLGPNSLFIKVDFGICLDLVSCFDLVLVAGCHHHGKTVHQQIQVIWSGRTTVRSLSLNCIGAKVLHWLGHYEAKLTGSTNHTKVLLYLRWRYYHVQNGKAWGNPQALIFAKTKPSFQSTWEVSDEEKQLGSEDC